MALALYRKYRPRTFAEVIGQEHVTEPLSQALRSGRLHHAYLFSGPRGCGKTSSARILARSLNCEQGPTPEPCGVCASCRSLANDGTGSIDVIEIDAASHGGVDDARDLREKAFFAPASSRFKIYVIDEAHMVSSAGFNALLKLVEEPPDYVKFIFATTEPEKVLGTIKSRTHHYPFRLIPPATLRPYLQQLTEAEGVHVEPAVLPLVVRAGGGSARDTLSVLDQLISGAGPEGVTYSRAVSLLGVTDVALIDEMCDALAAGDGATAYATIDRVAEAGHDPRRFASDLLERFRDLIILQQVPDAVTKGLIDGPADQLDAMTAQAIRLGPATLSRCADIVHNGLIEMRGTTAPRLLLELITARMLLPGADDSSGALLHRLERMERRLTLSGDAAGSANPYTVRPQHKPAPTPQTGGPDAPIEGAPGDGASGGRAGISAARAAAAAASRRAPVTEPSSAQAPTAQPPVARAQDVVPTAGEASTDLAQETRTTAGRPANVPAQDAQVLAGQVANASAQDARTTVGQAAGAPTPDASVLAGQPVSTLAQDAPVTGGRASTGTDRAAGLTAAQASPAQAHAASSGPSSSEVGVESAARGSRPSGPSGPAQDRPSQNAASPDADVIMSDDVDWDAEPEDDYPYPEDGFTATGPGAESQSAGEPSRAGDHAAQPPRARRPEPAGLLPDAPEEPDGIAAVQVPGQLSAAAIREVWPEIITAVGRQSKKVAALASGATVRDLDGQTVVLTFRFPAHAKMVAAEPDLIANALYEALGGRWQIRCEVAGEGGAIPVSSGGGTAATQRPAAAPSQATPAQGRAAQAQGRPARAAQSATPARRREPAAPASASPPSNDDDDWPEPAKPGGLAVSTSSSGPPAVSSGAGPAGGSGSVDEEAAAGDLGLVGDSGSAGGQSLSGGQSFAGGQSMAASQGSAGGQGLGGGQSFTGGQSMAANQDSASGQGSARGQGLAGEQSFAGGQGLAASQDSAGGQGFTGGQGSAGGQSFAGGQGSAGGQGLAGAVGWTDEPDSLGGPDTAGDIASIRAAASADGPASAGTTREPGTNRGHGVGVAAGAAPGSGAALGTESRNGFGLTNAGSTSESAVRSRGSGLDNPVQPGVDGRAQGRLQNGSGSSASSPAAGNAPTAPGAGVSGAAGGVGRAGSGFGSGGGLAAARAAAAGARNGSAANPGAQPASARPGATPPDAWSDASAAEEPPYDPDYDGPARGGGAAAGPARGGTAAGPARGGTAAGPARGSAAASGQARAGAAVGYEGFDPGDEPLDEVIDEKTARQSSEQQAMQLLQDAFGAEKIGES